MRRLLAAAVMTLGVAATLPAQEIQRVDVIDVHATLRPHTVCVPFAFQASRASLPAGDYQIKEGPFSQTATLLNVKTRREIVLITQAVVGHAGTMRFTFQRAGDRYYLRQIWKSGTSMGMEVPVSKAEREAQKTAADATTAGN